MGTSSAPENPACEPLTGDSEHDARTVARFRAIIYQGFREHPRKLSWRETDNPYQILVSEIMLQQTQVARVAAKYEEFVGAFPDFNALAQAPLRTVLRRWTGLGYNRRAIALQQCARRVVEEFGGNLPSDPHVLLTFPGIGPATAAAICAFAFRQPAVLIETNIRRVFLHFFFRGQEKVRDRAIRPLVEATIDRTDPRTWYYALMDYGVMLAKEHPNANRKSAHYARQARFEGSDRQLRGKIVRLLVERSPLSLPQIIGLVGREPERVERNLRRLVQEGLLTEHNGRFRIA